MDKHKPGTGNDRLRSLTRKAQEARPNLPYVHSTDGYALREMLADGAITPQECSVFAGEMLTYLFYGKPAFRPNIQAEPTSLKHYFPVCFIFKPEYNVQIKRVFPFDSGAFENGYYADYMHNRMQIGDFALDPDPSSPRKFVSLFFGSSAEYLEGKTLGSVSLDESEFEANSYLALASARGANAIDGRSSGIEVQTETDIPLDKAIMAVILPSSLAEGSLGAQLSSIGIDPLPYSTFDRSRPNEYIGQITNICINYYQQKKILGVL